MLGPTVVALAAMPHAQPIAVRDGAGLRAALPVTLLLVLLAALPAEPSAQVLDHGPHRRLHKSPLGASLTPTSMESDC